MIRVQLNYDDADGGPSSKLAMFERAAFKIDPKDGQLHHTGKR